MCIDDPKDKEQTDKDTMDESTTPAREIELDDEQSQDKVPSPIKTEGNGPASTDDILTHNGKPYHPSVSLTQAGFTANKNLTISRLSQVSNYYD